MKTLLRIGCITAMLLLHSLPVWSLTIVAPSEGQIVYAGSRLDVIVKPDLGEKWEEVILHIFPMYYDILKGEYREEIEIPEEKTGVITFTVMAYDKLGKKIKLSRKLLVKLPPNVVLQSIIVDDYKTLFKLPLGSPLDMQRIESRQLHVDGMYSDGVERDLTLSSSGTTYTSSNEQIVTVSPDGKMTAQGIGTAKITVRNGQHSAVVDVVVKPYRQPQR